MEFKNNQIERIPDAITVKIDEDDFKFMLDDELDDVPVKEVIKEFENKIRDRIIKFLEDLDRSKGTFSNKIEDWNFGHKGIIFIDDEYRYSAEILFTDNTGKTLSRESMSIKLNLPTVGKYDSGFCVYYNSDGKMYIGDIEMDFKGDVIILLGEETFDVEIPVLKEMLEKIYKEVIKRLRGKISDEERNNRSKQIMK